MRLGVFPKYSLLVRVRTKNPQEAWGAFRDSRIGVFGLPQRIQIDECGVWKNELRRELRSERRIKLSLPEVGAHRWIAERRNGIARGTYNRLQEGDRFSSKQILAEVRWRMNNLISGGGFPAYQMFFGPDPADLY